MRNRLKVEFVRNIDGQPTVVRTEFCDNEFEVDFILEQEEGHYDTARVEEIRDKQ